MVMKLHKIVLFEVHSHLRSRRQNYSFSATAILKLVKSQNKKKLRDCVSCTWFNDSLLFFCTKIIIAILCSLELWHDMIRYICISFQRFPSSGETTESSGRLHPLWPQNKRLHTPRTTDRLHTRQGRWIQTELAFTLAKNATKQLTRKENN
jgi:hypothetical protein